MVHTKVIIVESDYYLYERDDDLYEDRIGRLRSANKKWKKVAQDVDLCASDDELKLPDSDDEEVKFKFKNFPLVDMANPKFKLDKYLHLLNSWGELSKNTSRRS